MVAYSIIRSPKFNFAFFKAFRPGVVDMEETVANLNAITLPDAQFGTDFEITLPEITLE
jgi:hypothetical protein